MGASKTGIDRCLVNLVGQSQASGNKHGNKVPPPTPDAAGRDVITFILGVAGTPSLKSPIRLVPLRAC